MGGDESGDGGDGGGLLGIVHKRTRSPLLLYPTSRYGGWYGQVVAFKAGNMKLSKDSQKPSNIGGFQNHVDEGPHCVDG